MSRYWHLSRVLSGTAQGSTSAVASAPIVLQPRVKVLPNGTKVNVPGSGALIDLVSATFETVVTGQAGTSPTLTTVVEGTNSFMDNNTTTTADITSSGTTLALTARDGIAQYSYILLMATDGSAYEWVQVTSATATGAGNHTIVRGALGTTGVAFTSGAYVFFTNSWTAVPTNDGTTTTLATSEVSISAAGAAAPVISTLDMQQLDMNRMPFPIIRVKTTVGGSSTPTATYQVSVSGLIQAQEYARAK